MLGPITKARGGGGSCRRGGQVHTELRCPPLSVSARALANIRRHLASLQTTLSALAASAAVRPRGPAGVAGTAFSCSLAREMVKRAGTSAILSMTGLLVTTRPRQVPVRRVLITNGAVYRCVTEHVTERPQIVSLRSRVLQETLKEDKCVT